jgi:hypothetical protein
VAARAPIVAVLRRGPSAWSSLGRWDVARGVYEPGAWMRATIYPQRCDLSPDGRWLCYFTLKAGARWRVGATYIAISRLPWATALAAWATCGTWTRGLHFVEPPRRGKVGPPDEGDLRSLTRRFGLAVTAVDAFAVERRRGWTESAGSRARDRRGDPWDTSRAGRLEVIRSRPGRGDTVALCVGGRYAAFREGERRDGPVHYSVLTGGRAHPLDDVQWADWSPDGRLLVATTDGRLQIRAEPLEPRSVVSDVDLAALRPTPTAPPPDASRW